MVANFFRGHGLVVDVAFISGFPIGGFPGDKESRFLWLDRD